MKRNRKPTKAMVFFSSLLFLFGIELILSAHCLALNEIFDLYTPPQALGMGNAVTADATGYLSNYYNPAGLAKGHKGKWETILLDVETLASAAALSRIVSAKSFGVSQLMAPMTVNPGEYTYFHLSSVSSLTTRDFGISFLGHYQYAALSDGTNIDISNHVDIGPSVGLSTNLFGNLLKIGAAGKLLLREELQGDYPISAMSSSSAVASASREGIGMGVDLGILLTLPYRFLPTWALVWKDALNTQFLPVNILNANAGGAPTPISQTVNTAFSIHPILSKNLVSTIAVELQHLERTDLPFQKKFHLGFQIEDEKSFYIWFGANQLLLTGGVALRLPGGNLELGTYAVDVGAVDQMQEDRRYMLRYTVSF